MSIYRGSDWSKWDLHVHTPFTKLNDQYIVDDGEDKWDIFCRKIHDSDIEVIGITDYFSIDNYFTFLSKYKEKYPDSKKVFFPNVEFRLESKNSANEHIQVHVIFANIDRTLKKLNDFMTRLKLFSTDDVTLINKFCIDDDIKSIGYDKAMVRIDSNDGLEGKLKENFSSDEYLLVGVANGYGSLRPGKNDSRGAHYAKELDKKCNLFFGTSKNVDFYLNKISGRDEFNLPIKAVLSGSDSHSFEDLDNKLGKQYNDTESEIVWIKADHTFEGLKQIVYEPENRIRINEHRPQEALHKIDKITLDFNEATLWNDDPFCYNSFNDKIIFSSYLTCVIGGRGSGKSTLLNLIAEKIGKGNSFFSNLNISSIASKVNFEPNTIENIEFLAQNTIEEFATDNKKFTQAIFERINKASDDGLINLENEIDNELSLFDDKISLLLKRKELHTLLIEIRNDLNKNKGIVQAFSDKQFVENKERLQVLQKEKIELDESRKKYEVLFLELKRLSEEYTKFDSPKNNYETYFNSLKDEITKLYHTFQGKDYTEDKEKLQNLSDDIEKCQKDIENFLREKGMDEANIKDAQFASSSIEDYEHKVKKVKNDIIKLQRDKNNFSYLNIDEKIDNFKVMIDDELEKINIKFSEIANKNPQEVKNIKVDYTLNKDVFNIVFDEFVNKIGIGSQISSFRKAFKDYLCDVEFNEVLAIQTSSKLLEKIPLRNTQAYTTLKSVFDDNTNFLVYKTIVKKHLRDVKRNKVLTVYYDNKSLSNSSFGQKCTAAIVVLLSLGNNPIIIDEPEAHLDSSLIANYLVELIKEQKQHRQIIFATHNANFVLNADAELIIKLENNSGQTESASFSIENTKHRDDLLKLEGGKEAFKKREQKYNI